MTQGCTRTDVEYSKENAELRAEIELVQQDLEICRETLSDTMADNERLTEDVQQAPDDYSVERPDIERNLRALLFEREATLDRLRAQCEARAEIITNLHDENERLRALLVRHDKLATLDVERGVDCTWTEAFRLLTEETRAALNDPTP